MVKSSKPGKISRGNSRIRSLPKAPTGIQGLDELTGGGLPRGRPTLLCGGAGCGKTVLAMEFLVHGATECGEPGVFMAFEENTSELAVNLASLGHDLEALVAQKKLVLSSVRIERSQLEEAGEYDLEGLFLRLGNAIDSIGAKRVVLDTIEALFAGLSNTAILRAELRRLFGWLKEKGVTVIITAERGEGAMTRQGLEEYVTDCVILLDHRVAGRLATRLLRIVKYRGSTHGTSEFPFLIDEHGISVMTLAATGLRHEAGTGRVSSGVPQLDAMMGGKGYLRGSSVLVSGTAGTGKTSLAAQFAHAATSRGEGCLWIAFEESASQIIRNMRSIGVDLEPAVRTGKLHLHAERPTMFGLEMHLLTIYRLVNQFKPRVVIIDPITCFTPLGNHLEINAMLTRLIDFFKAQQITTLFTSLTEDGPSLELSESGVSSLMDTWLLLRDVQTGAERNRVLALLKSRGMAHSNQVREFRLTDRGIELRDVYVGPSGALLTGSARVALEAQEKAQTLVLQQAIEGEERELDRKRQAMEAEVAVLRAKFEVERAEAAKTVQQGQSRAGVLAGDRGQMARSRESGAGAARRTTKSSRERSP
jgi:circadian clock protein KaiC